MSTSSCCFVPANVHQEVLVQAETKAEEAQRMISFTSSVMSVRDASSIQRSGVTVCSEPAAHGDDPRREQTHR